jgi:hypothetical protein
VIESAAKWQYDTGAGPIKAAIARALSLDRNGRLCGVAAPGADREKTFSLTGPLCDDSTTNGRSAGSAGIVRIRLD